MKSSEMNAAFGLVQFERFKEFEKIRRANIEQYLENLQDIGDLILPDDSIKPNWLAIPLQTEKRYELLHFLEENNIQFNMDNEQLDLLMVKKLRIINIEKISV